MVKNILCAVLLAAAPAAAAADQLSLSRGKLTVKANINTEVFYTVMNLAGSSAGLRTTDYMPVYADMAAYFAPYKDHPAVKEVDDGGTLSWDSGFSFNVPAEFPLYFSDLPEGRRIAEYDKEFLDRLEIPGAGPGDLDKKAAYMDAYWGKVKDFYKASAFGTYWERERPRYAAFVSELYAVMPAADVVKLHEDYHANPAFSSFTVVASPLTLPSGGNYGLSVRNFGGDTAIYNIMSASRSGFGSAENAEMLALHEFGHSFCNPVAAKYYGEALKYAFLQRGLRGRMDEAYGDWRSVMNELLVRAVHARLVLKLKGEAAARDFLWTEREHEGFAFIDDWYALLADYEASRAKYRTLYDFYPRLLADLDGWGVYEVTEPRQLGIRRCRTVPGGVRLTDTAKDGAAWAAGLRNGDTITAVDGAALADAAAYRGKADAFDKLPAGGSMIFTVLRSGGSASVKVERAPASFTRAVRLGGEYRNVTRRAPKALGLWWAGFGPGGMTVGFAAPGAPAYLAGIRKGDLVVSAGGITLDGREAYDKACAAWAALPEGGAMEFKVLRGGAATVLNAKSEWEDVTETVKI